MTWDEQGHLVPKTATTLIKDLQKIIDKEGDLPVWIRFDWTGYERGLVENAPMSDAPGVKLSRRVRGARDYWAGQFEKLILIEVSGQ